MELNTKAIKILINALIIAKEATQIKYSQQQIDTRLTPLLPGAAMMLGGQATLIDSIDEYDMLLAQMRELESRDRLNRED